MAPLQSSLNPNIQQEAGMQKERLENLTKHLTKTEA